MQKCKMSRNAESMDAAKYKGVKAVRQILASFISYQTQQPWPTFPAQSTETKSGQMSWGAISTQLAHTVVSTGFEGCPGQLAAAWLLLLLLGCHTNLPTL